MCFILQQYVCYGFTSYGRMYGLTENDIIQTLINFETLDKIAWLVKITLKKTTNRFRVNRKLLNKFVLFDGKEKF